MANGKNPDWPERLPRVSLGFFPTPLHRLDRLSRQLGYEIYMKRDDLAGPIPYGGNKIRILEFLLADAMDQGCDTVITYGAVQSNHAMETVAAARKCGLTPIVYLFGPVGAEDDLRGNLLLDALLDGEIHILPQKGEETFFQVADYLRSLAFQRTRELEQEGHRCYEIPPGGATPVGAVGYLLGYLEMMKQMEALGKNPDHLFLSAGSGGTLAGLAAGKALRGDSLSITGFLAGPKGPGNFRGNLLSVAKGALKLLGQEETPIASKELHIVSDCYGAGYGIPLPEANRAVRLLAKEEGILVDPVYSGKAFYGMLRHLRQGKIPKGSTVLFLHTGGTAALFAGKDTIGDLLTQ